VCSCHLLRRIERLGVPGSSGRPGHPLHSVVPCRGPWPARLAAATNSSAVSTSLPPWLFFSFQTNPPRLFLGVIGRGHRTAASSVEEKICQQPGWGTEGQADACVRACARVGLTYGLGLQGLEATRTPAAAAAGPVALARAVQVDQTHTA